MKKLFISSSFLFVSAFAFGQSVLIEPGTSSKQFVVKSIGDRYGHFSTTDVGGADLFFKRSATGDGSAGTNVGQISTFPNKFSIFGSFSHELRLGANGTEYMTINNAGLVGIGTITPSAKFHVFSGISGVTPNPASQIFVESSSNNYLGVASPDSKESGILFGKPTLGAESGGIIYDASNNMLLRTGGNFNRMTIDNSGKVGIGTTTPQTTLEVLGTTQWVANFSSPISQSYVAFRRNTVTPTGYVGTFNDATNNSIDIGTSLFNITGSLFLTTNTVPRLTITPAGYIKLGDNVASTPSIRIKKLTTTTNATQGGFVTVAHGIANPTKIISITVLVQYAGSGGWVANGFTTSAGYQFDYQYDGTDIYITTKAGNSASIVNQAVKIVITYEE
jgi:hypothetical protein